MDGRKKRERKRIGTMRSEEVHTHVIEDLSLEGETCVRFGKYSSRSQGGKGKSREGSEKTKVPVRNRKDDRGGMAGVGSTRGKGDPSSRKSSKTIS